MGNIPTTFEMGEILGEGITSKLILLKIKSNFGQQRTQQTTSKESAIFEQHMQFGQ